MADRRYFQMIGTPNSEFLKSLLESPVDLAETARDKIEALGGELLGYYMSISEPKLYGVLILPDSDTVAAIAYQRIAAGAMEDVKFMDIGLMNAVCGLGWTGIERMDQTRLVNEGAMAEQFIGQHLQALLAASANRELSYWLREGRSANAEVDYVAGAGRQRLIPDVTQTPVRRYSGGMRPLTRSRASAYSLNSR